MKFEKPYKGHSGWEITLFGFRIFIWHKDQYHLHKKWAERSDFEPVRRVTVEKYYL
jgi:hypothetical protein